MIIIAISGDVIQRIAGAFHKAIPRLSGALRVVG
jgi:hypothetical protein